MYKRQIQQNKINDEYIELEFIADIDSGWHLYSQYTGQYYNDDGPVPTSFTFKISDYYSLLDSATFFSNNITELICSTTGRW